MKRSDFPDTNDEEYKRSRFLPCALQFLYIDDDTLRRLQSLELTSYEGFPLHLDRYTVHGDRRLGARSKISQCTGRKIWKNGSAAHSKSSDSGVCACHERETGVCLFAIQRLGGRVLREYPESDLGSCC